MKKYSIILTVLLAVLTVSLIVLVGYSIYTLFDDYVADKSAEDLMNQFGNNYVVDPEENPDVQDPPEIQDTDPEPDEESNPDQNPNTSTNPKPNTSTSNPSGGSSGYGLGTYYKGNKVIGTIYIPVLKIQYPIFNVDNSNTLKVGTAALYPTNVEEALNKQGNVVIAGHNYRNTRMFSRIHTLKNGDSIFITNIYGDRLEYKVYNVYQTNESDFTYATRDTNGKIEISLTTCTNDVTTRTIVWAKVD